MKVSIRDDDSCFFTKKEELLEAYKDFDYPVSFAVIPFGSFFHGDSSPYDSSTELRQNEWIGNNSELVDTIKNLISTHGGEVLQHGFDHSFKKTNDIYLPETIWKDKTTLKNDIVMGRDYLEKVFNCKISVFSSATNAIDKKTMKILSTIKMNFSGLFNFRSFAFDRYTIKNIIKRLFSKIIYRESLCSVLVFNGHSECPIIGVSSFEKMVKQYNICKKHNWNFTIVTHYWQLNKNNRRKDTLIKFCKFIEDDGAEVTSVSECFNKGH